jgi:ribosome biogenesis GTPase
VTALLVGTVLERDGAVYRVLAPEGEVRAVLRGKAKRDAPRIVVGDRVRLEPAGEGGLFGIAGAEPRTSLLARRVPEGRGERPVVANVDQVVVVTATRDPDPLPHLLDRLLVVAEANDLPALVVLNKVDLAPGEGLAQRFERAGYSVFLTSARTGAGLDRLGAQLRGRESVVTGPSGAGKSSLLNALQPGLRLRTGEISRKIRRGTATTVGAVMVPLASGGFLVDTPGFSEVGLWGLDPAQLAHCFPDFRPLLGQCRYPDCTHVHEPGCVVAAAAGSGLLQPDRLESYRILLRELHEAPREWE